MQEATGLFGPLIIDPRESDPVRQDREHVIVLSDWSDDDPHDWQLDHPHPTTPLRAFWLATAP